MAKKTINDLDLRSVRCTIQGVPYAHQKPRGDTAAPERWSDAVVERTKDLPKINGPCLLRVTFLLPPDKFPSDHPYGSDLDNLLKRFCDALNKTVLSDVPGKDGCIVALEVTKTRVESNDEAGAELELVSWDVPNRRDRGGGV